MISKPATVVLAVGLFLPSLASSVQADIAGFGNGSGWQLNRGGPGNAASFSGQQLTVTTAGSNDSYNKQRLIASSRSDDR